MKWCAQTFPPFFGIFTIFDRYFSELIAPFSNENEKCIASERPIPSEKGENRIKIDP